MNLFSHSFSAKMTSLKLKDHKKMMDEARARQGEQSLTSAVFKPILKSWRRHVFFPFLKIAYVKHALLIGCISFWLSLFHLHQQNLPRWCWVCGVLPWFHAPPRYFFPSWRKGSPSSNLSKNVLSFLLILRYLSRLTKTGLFGSRSRFLFLVDDNIQYGGLLDDDKHATHPHLFPLQCWPSWSD